ncbi:MAG TPA: arginine--tRNA ligase [Armatimonadetes bacterium]|nr:arginine--tRNA ligase [Armatimonadota bacterium]
MQQIIADAVHAALESLRASWPALEPDRVAFTVQPSSRPEHGDLQTNAAMIAAAQLGARDKRAVAGDLAAALTFAPGTIARVEVAGPGFLNFFVDDRYYQDLVARVVAADDDWGRLTLGTGQSVNVEFVSANPTGPLTVGHGRNAVLGDVVARLHEWAGYKVTREYYFNNAGRQMHLLGESVRARYRELLGAPLELPEGGYQGGYIADIAATLRAEQGDELAAADEAVFRGAAERAIFAQIEATCARLGISFDRFFNEQSLYDSGAIQAVLDQLRTHDLAYEADGATWLRGEPLGLDKDRVLVKSSGEPTYRLPDMAYHLDKLGRGYETVIDVFGADHIDTCQEVLAVVRALGGDTERVKVMLYQFVTLTRDGQQVKMSTRQATYETLDGLLDEVGADAVRYFFALRSPTSHMEFDLALALRQANDNPMYYVQYGHARINSILRREEAAALAAEPLDLALLTDEAERALIVAVSRLPEVLARALAEHEPHRLPTYAAEVATAFHQFYDRCPILSAETRALARARLELAQAARICLRNVLAMLGVSAPERM